MRVRPDLDVRFPAAKESELMREMEARATPPWQWRHQDDHAIRLELRMLA